MAKINSYEIPIYYRRKAKFKCVITIKIDATTFFSIKTPVPYHAISMGLFGRALLNMNSLTFHLFDDVDGVWLFIGDLIWYIDKVIAGEKTLPLHRLGKLGYEYNQYEFALRHTTNMFDFDSWDGLQYAPWSAGLRHPTAWLYTCEGKIYFEITPVYDSKRHKIPFKVFMRNYRPYVRKILTMDQLLHLRHQAQVVSDLMFKNRNDPDFVPAEYEYENKHCLK